MARLLFSAKALASLVRAGDSQQFGVDLKNNRETIINSAASAAVAGEINLAAYAVTMVRGKRCVSYTDYSTHLLLRAIARHLRNRHRISPPSRDRIVRGVIETLLDGTPMIAIRRDISSFYESIPIEPIRDSVLYDTGSSSLVRDYLRKYFDAHCPVGQLHGLPRGIGLSALFSEMSMKEFDQRVRSIPGVFKYYRFADDILIFSTRHNADFDQQVVGFLPQFMAFNSKKSFEIHYPGKKAQAEPCDLDYLGYRFSTQQTSDRAESRTVRVAISERKLNRLKTRIILSLRDFERHGNWLLLRDRCRFATGNYKVRRHGSDVIKGATHVFSGIYYNYKMCGEYNVRNRRRRVDPYDASELKALDGFYHSILKSQYAMRSLVVTSQQMATLSNLSFHRGYTARIKVRFPADRVVRIKKAWRNV